MDPLFAMYMGERVVFGLLGFAIHEKSSFMRGHFGAVPGTGY